MNPSSTQYPLEALSAEGRCLRVALRHTLSALALLPASDESAMNFEGVGVYLSKFLMFPKRFCELEADIEEPAAFPSVRT